ncbi:MAG: hypothetical protein P1V51_01600 [Deltaproteobacteria bacterium]|nr:hypothetical protein [Deltaproteobacteria bacterium]
MTWLDRGIALSILSLSFLLGGCPKEPLPCDCTQCVVGEVCYECECVPGCTSSNDCQGSRPNCDTRFGVCFAACAVAADCIDPATPVCDPVAGLCRPPCPIWPCPGFEPNCDEAAGVCLAPCPQTSCAAIGKAYCGTDGRCYDPCADHLDCPNADLPNCNPDTTECQGPCARDADCPPALPVCDPGTGLCQGRCPGAACPDALPVCEPVSGRCLPPCRTSSECRDLTLPNCGLDGRCHPPCAAHADCELADRPSCDLDPASPTSGFCMPPCGTDADCPDGAPRCVAELCEPGCTSDGHCAGGESCHLASGICLPSSCGADADCAPPRFVCQGSACVPGCTSHADCPAAQRCLLSGPSAGHCEARDCLSDAACNPPSTVCDTDGGGLPEAGGYCVAGCNREYDCPHGQTCDPGSGRCSAVDYGDVGQPCPGGICTACASGLGVDDLGGGTLCSAQCCRQADCPAGWVCRPEKDPDAACSGCMLRLCQPDAALGLAARAHAPCIADAECRSGVCEGGVCKESCCTGAHCPGEVCSVVSGGRLACLAGAPADDLGTAGCATPPAAPTQSCRAGLCSAVVSYDTSCATPASCPADANAWCGDYDRQQDANDCVLDYCTLPCCTAADCAGAVNGRRHFCGKQNYGAYGDFDLCLLAPDTATGVVGAPCTHPAECASGVCDLGAGVCLARCCVDADCSGGRHCKVEPHEVFGTTRYLSVCR